MRTRLILLVLLAPLAVVLAACGKQSPPVSAASPAAQALQARSTAAAKASFTAEYHLDSPTGAQLATVRVFQQPSGFRVDVVEKSATASLYGGTDAETVACTVASGIPTTCYAVAEPGAAIPAAFDAGVQRVFRRDLPTFAQTTDGLQVTAAAPDAVLTGTTGAQCYAVHRGTASQVQLQPVIAQIDDGTYCLTAGGLLAGFVSASGRLVLASHGGAPTAADLKIPAPAQALPAGVSASASGSPPALLPTAS